MTPTYVVCPKSKLPLALLSLDAAGRQIASGGPLAARAGDEPAPVGPTPSVLVRADRRIAYPLVDGVPVLLVPEQLTALDSRQEFDLALPQYAEAYQEMAYYNRVAEEDAAVISEEVASGGAHSSPPARRLAALAGARQEERSFLNPPRAWIEEGYEYHSLLDAYRHLAPVEGRRVLQLGGRGYHAVTFLLAGARESVVISPMINELRFAQLIGRHYGVAERLQCVAAVAEELPFEADTFDAIFTLGCLHHTVTSMALPECARVLRPGGRFAAVEPWQAPFYRIGIRLFGKSEPNPFCHPMTERRAEPLYAAFDSSEVIHHGALTRYPLKALGRVGVPFKPSLITRLGRCDDAVSSLVPGLRALGSSVALLGTLTGTCGYEALGRTPTARVPAEAGEQAARDIAMSSGGPSRPTGTTASRPDPEPG